MAAQNGRQNGRHRAGGGQRPPPPIAYPLLAVAVTVLVVLPRFMNGGTSSTASCSTLATSGIGDWEVERLPMMDPDAKSRGWKPVYVYAAVNLTEEELKLDRHSKDGRDALILALTEADDAKNTTASKLKKKNGDSGRTPYFVDLGAGDPVVSSNSLLLERNGWEGLCVEPNHRAYWYGLASRRTCTIIGAVVGGTPAEDGKEVSVDFDKEMPKRNIVSLVTILRETNAPSIIDYLSLDSGGKEYIGGSSSVLKNFPWETYRFRFVTLAGPRADLKASLEKGGYEAAGSISSDVTLMVNKKLVALSDKEIEQISQKTNVPFVSGGSVQATA